MKFVKSKLGDKQMPDPCSGKNLLTTLVIFKKEEESLASGNRGQTSLSCQDKQNFP